MNSQMKNPNEYETNTRMLEFFCRHLVSLCVSYEHQNTASSRREPRFAAYGGTILCIRGIVCFLTAGHIVRELEEVIQAGNLIIHRAVLADTFGWKRVSGHPIPLDLVSAPRFFVDDDKEGLDFGLIALNSNHVRLLAANGIVPIFEENWISQSKASYDAYLMLGVPKEFTSEYLSQSGMATVTPTMFRVRKLSQPPEDTKPTRYSRFVGQIDAGLPLASLHGMSGGPIFGINLGTFRYWVVALQSSYRPNLGVVFGCPIPVLASLVTEWLDRLLSKGNFTFNASTDTPPVKSV